MKDTRHLNRAQFVRPCMYKLIGCVTNFRYTGNYFHDFTDVLIPIFITARRFQGEVEFLVTDIKIYLIMKYLPIFKNLTKYDIIDFDSDDQVRCYKKAYIGLTSHDDFGIDPERIPERYTLVDFTRFMRTTYGLTRDVVEIPVQKKLGRKPRLMIVARAKTRRFMNLDEIVRQTEKLGFDVVATETTDDLARFSVIVNSCDAIMGVHGAGLTNMVFLPINAVFIQILPWGGLEWVAGMFSILFDPTIVTCRTIIASSSSSYHEILSHFFYIHGKIGCPLIMI